MSDHAKAHVSPMRNPQLWVVFTCFFINFLSFSMVIPLAPEMIDYYLEPGAGRTWFVEKGLIWLAQQIGREVHLNVFFGGLLAALFAIAQYISSPIWGALSDRYGRRSILLWSCGVFAVMQLIWIFSGSLELYFLSRFFSGLSSGNVPVVSAAIADLTDRKNRLSGMNVLAIGFGLGWTLAPLIGGICVLVDPLAFFPQTAALGVTPFSFAAAVSLTLAVFNFWVVWAFFKESLAPQNRRSPQETKLPNPFAVFRLLPEHAYNRLNLVFLLYVGSYSGCNFNVSFLAFNRFETGATTIGIIYMTAGASQILTQTFLLPPLERKIGQTRCALLGFVVTACAVVMMALSFHTLVLAIGIALSSVGGGLAFPSLSALSSLLAPNDRQGEYIGIFRSMASAGAAFGPLILSGLFTLLGGTTGFLIFGAVHGAAWWIAKKLPHKLEDV